MKIWLSATVNAGQFRTSKSSEKINTQILDFLNHMKLRPRDVIIVPSQYAEHVIGSDTVTIMTQAQIFFQTESNKKAK